MYWLVNSSRLQPNPVNSDADLSELVRDLRDWECEYEIKNRTKEKQALVDFSQQLGYPGKSCT